MDSRIRQINSGAIWLGIVAIALTICSAYWPALHGGFFWDDPFLLTNNPLIRNPHGLWDIWFSTRSVDYLPLTFTCFWAEWRMWGASPLGYHLVNLFLHFASCLLLWGGLRQLRVSAAAAFLAAILFAVHPVNVMSVAWISETKNTLSMALYLLALLMWAKSFTASQLPARTLRAARVFYALSLLFFALALLAKSSVVMLPGVLLIMAWWQRGKIERQDIRRSLPFFFLALMAGLITYYFQDRGVMVHLRLETITWPIRIARAGWVFWFYAYKAIWPTHLTAIYPAWNLPHHNWAILYLPLLATITVGYALWRMRHICSRGPLTAMLYMLVSLLPVMGLIDTAFMWYSMVSDHLQYVAIIGVIVLIAAVLAKLIKLNRSIGLIITILVVCLFWFQSRSRAEVYQNEETFWQNAVAGNPASPQARYNLGSALQKRNDIAGAIKSYRIAVRLEPHFADAHNNLGLLLARQGKLDAAVAELQLAKTYRPDAISYRNLGLTLLADKRVDDGITALYKSLQLDPADADLHLQLSAALSNQSRIPEAILEARQAVRLKPDWPNALNDLAWMLANSATANRNERDEAVTYAEKACRLTQEKNPAILDTLAVAYGADGQRNQAITTERRAIQLALETGDSSVLVGQLKDHLQGFINNASTQPNLRHDQR